MRKRYGNSCSESSMNATKSLILISAVFVEKCRPRYASQHYADSSYELDQSRVCVVDGKIVSYVRVSDRSMYIGEAVVKLGGIGMVVTSEEHRRRGLFVSIAAGTRLPYMEAPSLRPKSVVHHYPAVLHAAWLGKLFHRLLSSWNSTTKRPLLHRGGKADRLTSKKI